MNSIHQNQRYLPHTLETRYHAVMTYRNGNSVSFVCRRYKISKASLMRWNKRFDGTKDSLRDKSHRPLSKHPSAHTEDELRHIKNYLRRNPTMTMIELYAKLKFNKGYTRHPCSLFRILRTMGYFKEAEKKEKEVHSQALSYTPNDRRKMAARCKICSNPLLYWQNARSVLSIHGH